jgi:hypothetical protein
MRERAVSNTARIGIPRVRHTRPKGRLLHALIGVAVATVTSAGFAAPASAAAGFVVHAIAEPTVLSSSDGFECRVKQSCDRYQLLVLNAGGSPTSGPITLTDVLPPGITTLKTPEDPTENEPTHWECTAGAGNSTVTCTLMEVSEEPIPAVLPAGTYAPALEIQVTPPPVGSTGVAVNHVTVEGGGTAVAASATVSSPVNVAAPPFEADELTFQATEEDGTSASRAGGHPWALTETFGTPIVAAPRGAVEGNGSGAFAPVRSVKTASFEVPLGFFGNPQSLPTCTEAQLKFSGGCPPASKVGVFAASGAVLSSGQFGFTGNATECCSSVYNIKPEPGYPAELGLTFAHVPVLLFADVVHTASGYRLRVTLPGIPPQLELTDASLTLFGAPGRMNGSESQEAFLTNPSTCSGPLTTRAELEPWAEPGHVVVREAVAYSGLSGCELLNFNPVLAWEPTPGAGEGGTAEADSPSAFTATLSVPQTTDFADPTTPPLRNATVALPAGVTLNPAAAAGLAACPAQGSEGINLGSSTIGALGQDEGDPYATELGAGHLGGNDSPYDDDIYHSAPGRCPAAATVGTAELFTPLLPEGPQGEAPLTGHIYVAEPKCGGGSQPECTEASAENGELFGAYLEAEGHGVIVKLAGTLSIDPSSGQITASFAENPQLPVSEVRLHIHGGPRAPFATPQDCGPATTNSLLEPWNALAGPVVLSSFVVTGCIPGGKFAPGFSAGTTVPVAGGFAPFTLTFSRQDREQDLAGLTVHMPPGLLGTISSVDRCPEPAAQLGTCTAASQIGSTTTIAGAGTSPLVLGGKVYLTGPYKGAPFGLSVVVPADAGPFHLGNVVVRAAISVNPITDAITVVSDPLPQARDGVPFRLRTVNVTIDRSGFIFNPTNCAAQSIGATITSAQGGTANVSSPLAVSGCAALPFRPKFTVSTQGDGTVKGHGASLTVKLAFPHGGPQGGSQSGEANVRSVKVKLPSVLPARLTTLQKACTEKQFAENPAGCPKASLVGMAIAHTPILSVPLQGPVYLVSHGGAAFPDVVMVLQGEGVVIDLVGNTEIKGKVTTSTFASVPDAPVSSFELKLPEGEFSALAANGKLCTQNLVMPTEFVAQNGATLNQNTHIEVEGCSNTLSVVSKKVRGRTVTLGVWVPAAGRLSASGKGLSRASRASDGRKELKLTLRAARHRRFTTKIRLVFTPSSGKDRRKLGKSVTVKFGR